MGDGKKGSRGAAMSRSMCLMALCLALMAGATAISPDDNWEEIAQETDLQQAPPSLLSLGSFRVVSGTNRLVMNERAKKSNGRRLLNEGQWTKGLSRASLKEKILKRVKNGGWSGPPANKETQCRSTAAVSAVPRKCDTKEGCMQEFSGAGCSAGGKHKNVPMERGKWTKLGCFSGGLGLNSLNRSLDCILLKTEGTNVMMKLRRNGAYDILQPRVIGCQGDCFSKCDAVPRVLAKNKLAYGKPYSSTTGWSCWFATRIGCKGFIDDSRKMRACHCPGGIRPMGGSISHLKAKVTGNCIGGWKVSG